MTVASMEPELLHIEEAARVLSIARSSAYAMAAAGELPGLIRLGRSLRVSRRALLAWIDQQAQTNGGATPASVTPLEVDRDASGRSPIR